jgi:outer membrane protein OmpA-like peptidoglycan-associated protein
MTRAYMPIRTFTAPAALAAGLALVAGAFMPTGAIAQPAAAAPGHLLTCASAPMEAAAAESIEQRAVTVSAEIAPAFDSEFEDGPREKVSMPVYFKPGGSDMTPEAREALSAFADEVLTEGSARIAISAAPSFMPALYGETATQRASAVLDTLIELGVPASMISLEPLDSERTVPTATLSGDSQDV